MREEILTKGGQEMPPTDMVRREGWEHKRDSKEEDGRLICYLTYSPLTFRTLLERQENKFTGDSQTSVNGDSREDPLRIRGECDYHPSSGPVGRTRNLSRR